MVNTIVRTITFLVGLGTKAIAAYTQHAGTLSLPHTGAANLPGRMTAATNANTAHKEALLEMKNKQAAVKLAIRTGRRFLMVYREHLRPILGARYSESWSAAGFAGRLAVPTTTSKLLNALALAEAYLTAHPIADVGAAVAPERAALLHDNLAAAMTALAQHKEAVDLALTVRNQKAAALEKGLRTLLSELHQVLDPLDSRWLAFGFNKPGAKAIPDVPMNVIVTLIGTNVFAVKWTASARASHYRVWKKVIGVDEDYIPVGSPADLDFMLESMPGNSNVEVVVSAVNTGGESQWSNAVLVQTL